MASLFPVLGILALAFGPIAFFLWYAYSRDQLEPEPRRLVLKLFGWGLLAAIPALLLQRVLPLPYWVMGLLVMPVVNELLKFWVVRQQVYRHPEFDEPLDGIIFAAAVALGFATVTLVLAMVLTYFRIAQVTVPGVNLALAPWRSVLSLFALQGIWGVAGHALWSSLWGYTLGLAKFSPAPQRRPLMLRGLLAAIACHATFNALAMEPSWWLNRLGLGLLVVVLWFVVMRCLRQAAAISPFRSQA